MIEGTLKQHQMGDIDVWHLSKDEHEALRRKTAYNSSGALPSVLMTNIKWSEPPGTPVSDGTPGMKARDDDYLYICVSRNKWKRAPLEGIF